MESPGGNPDRQVMVYLFRNYAIGDKQMDEIYLDRINKENFAGLTVWIKNITFGVGTSYDGAAFRLGSDIFSRTEMVLYARAYRGKVDVQLSDSLMQISCTYGEFTDAANIVLILNL